MSFYVYIVANRRNGAIYTGMTDDIAQRVWQHKTKAFDGFTARYGCDKLVCIRFAKRGRAPSFANARSRNGDAVGS